MAHWTLEDVPWGAFDPRKITPDILQIAKAASLVEYNAPDYVRYLCNVFSDDAAFKAAAERWGVEEVQHGAALGRWASLADPSFDFDEAVRRFTTGYKLNTEVEASIRGSRTGELIARCIVETGTSSFYTALAEAADEPVLKYICGKIASDEFRHYMLFYNGMKRYASAENLGFWKRLGVAASRVLESEDDELAYAYYAANGGDEAYDRRRWNRSYASRAYSLYRRHHVETGMGMILRAVGLTPNGRLNKAVTGLAWSIMRVRTRTLARYRRPLEALGAR